jgi:hypothetical protein
VRKSWVSFIFDELDELCLRWACPTQVVIRFQTKENDTFFFGLEPKNPVDKTLSIVQSYASSAYFLPLFILNIDDFQKTQKIKNQNKT